MESTIDWEEEDERDEIPRIPPNYELIIYRDEYGKYIVRSFSRKELMADGHSPNKAIENMAEILKQEREK